MNFYEEFEAPEPERPEAHGIRRFFQILGQNCDGMLLVNIVFLLSCFPAFLSLPSPRPSMPSTALSAGWSRTKRDTP